MESEEKTGLRESAIKERSVRAAGSAGRHLNTSATAVELRVDLAKSGLSPEMCARVRQLAGRAVTRDGALVLVSRMYESQNHNRTAVRRRLAALLQRAAKVEKQRKPTRPRRAVREDRFLVKKAHGSVKQLRRHAVDGDGGGLS